MSKKLAEAKPNKQLIDTFLLLPWSYTDLTREVTGFRACLKRLSGSQAAQLFAVAKQRASRPFLGTPEGNELYTFLWSTGDKGRCENVAQGTLRISAS